MHTESFLSALRDAAGSAQVLSDGASREYYANDIFWQPGVLPLAVVLPQTRARHSSLPTRCGRCPRGFVMS